MADQPSIPGSVPNYWRNVAKHEAGSVPYTPNPMKYKYLLQNTYAQISNLVSPEGAQQQL